MIKVKAQKSETFEVTSNVLEATHFSAKTNLKFDSSNTLKISHITTGERPLVFADLAPCRKIEDVVLLKKSHSVTLEIDPDTASILHALVGHCNASHERSTRKLYSELSSVVQHGKYTVEIFDQPDVYPNITVKPSEQ